MLGKSCFIVASLVVGCTTTTKTPANDGALARAGVVDIKVVADTPDRTTIVALDSQGKQVGKVELIHGTITLRADDYAADAGKQAQGRDLHAELGSEVLDWQTTGFSDTSQMPSLATVFPKITAMVTDPRVKPLLDAWKVGWQPAPETHSGETAYYATDCSGQVGIGKDPALYTPGGTAARATFPLTGGGTWSTAMCNGDPTWAGVSFQQSTAAGETFNQDFLMMCCGDSSNNNGFLAAKTCSNEAYSDNGIFHSGCGDATVRCHSCYSFQAYSGGCTLSYQRDDYYYDALGNPYYYGCRNLGNWGQCYCNSTYPEIPDAYNVGYMSSGDCSAYGDSIGTLCALWY